MRRILALTAVAVVAGGCGGSEAEARKPAITCQPSVQPSTGAVVTVAPAKGRSGPPAQAAPGGPACVGNAAKPAPPPLDEPNVDAIAAAVLGLLNAERSSKDLGPLHANRLLKTAAQRMANLMVRQQFFSHDTPDGRSMVDRVKATGYLRGKWALGENLAWGSGALATPRAIVNGWMNSPAHRSNILDPGFRDVGIGIRLGAPSPDLTGGTTYVTDFGRHG